MRVALIIMVLGMYSAECMAELTVFSCSAPKGWRIDTWRLANGKNEVQTGDDGYTGTQPLFILDSDDPETLYEVIDPIRPEGVSKKLIDALNPNKLRKYPIVLHTPTQVSGVDVTEQGVYTTSLYPALKLVVLNRASHNRGTPHAIGATYSAECTISTR